MIVTQQHHLFSEDLFFNSCYQKMTPLKKILFINDSSSTAISPHTIFRVNCFTKGRPVQGNNSCMKGLHAFLSFLLLILICFFPNVARAVDVDLSFLSASQGFRILGAASSDRSGYIVSTAGDVNGDGIKDVIVGAYEADPPGKIGAGISYVIFGRNVATGGVPFSDIQLTTGATAMNAAVGFRILGAAAGDNSGWSVSAAGDVNKDNIDDIIIGTQYLGISYVIFGKSSAFADIQLTTTALSASVGFRILGVAGDNSGRAACAAGDVNGDGINDIIVGASSADPSTGTDAGMSYVIYGRNIPGGAAAFGDIQITSGATPLSNTVGFRIIGAAAGDRSGRAVRAAGDVNDDGIDDIIVSSLYADPPSGSDAGISYVIFGRNIPGGAAAFGDIQLTTGGTALSASVGFRILGAAFEDNSGWSVSSAGDLNGDGISDIIVGAIYADNVGTTNSGISYVIFGRKTSVVGPFGDIQLTTGVTQMNPTVGFRILGASTSNYCGYSVSAAGDVNGDGLDDIIVSAQSATPPPSKYFAGISYVIFGRNTAIVGTFSDIQLTENATPMDAAVGFRILGAAAFGQSGESVSTAGDINGDGFADVIIGASAASPTSSTQQGGISYVIFGQLWQPTPQPTSQPSTKPSAQPSRQPIAAPTTLPSNQPSSQPTLQPTYQPNSKPSAQPSCQPAAAPSSQPSLQPTIQPSSQPSSRPSVQPSVQPTRAPSNQPLAQPSMQPSGQPSSKPSTQPLARPSVAPSSQPSNQPSAWPSTQPTCVPSCKPSSQPSGQPSAIPSRYPTSQPTSNPSMQPSGQPSSQPSTRPSVQPTATPSTQPSSLPSTQPTAQPSSTPSAQPSGGPTDQLLSLPSAQPSVEPSAQPSMQPSIQPTAVPSAQPTTQPSVLPSKQPSSLPSTQPSASPSMQITAQPTMQPSMQPIMYPSSQPSTQPIAQPSTHPSTIPTTQPSSQPSTQPSTKPSIQPSSEPSAQPSTQPSMQPSARPSLQPAIKPSQQPTSYPTRQPTALPTVAPTVDPHAELKTVLVEGVLAVTSFSSTGSDGNVWLCGSPSYSAGSTICVTIDIVLGFELSRHFLSWAEVTPIAYVTSTYDISWIGRSVATTDATSNIAKCALEALSQLTCTVSTFKEVTFVAGSYAPLVQKLVYIGTAGSTYATIAVIEETSGAVQRYTYSSAQMNSIALLHIESPPNFVGSFVSGTCGSTSASANYIFAGMVRTDSGVMNAMYLFPASGSIMNSIDLVTTMSLEFTDADSCIAGGLQLNDGAGMHAYVLNVNSLYQKVIYGMRYRVQELVNNRRRLQSRTLSYTSVVRGMVRIGSTLVMVLEYTSTTVASYAGVSVVMIAFDTGLILQQMHIASNNASLFCPEIINTGDLLHLACTAQYSTNVTQALVLTIDQELTVSKLPAGFVLVTNKTVTAESVPFKRTKLPLTMQPAVSNVVEYAYNSADDKPSLRPTILPTPTPLTNAPSGQPSSSPTASPSVSPQPSSQPSSSGPTNTYKPTIKPTERPTYTPTEVPTVQPSLQTALPTGAPTTQPTVRPSNSPSLAPSVLPTRRPSHRPSPRPTLTPTAYTTAIPTREPTALPTMAADVVRASGVFKDPITFIVLVCVGGIVALIWCLYCLRKVGQYLVWVVRKDTRRVLFMRASNAKAVPRYPVLSAVVNYLMPNVNVPNNDTSATNSVTDITSLEIDALTTEKERTRNYSEFRGANAVGQASHFRDLEANIPADIAASEGGSRSMSDDSSVYVSEEGEDSVIYDSSESAGSCAESDTEEEDMMSGLSNSFSNNNSGGLNRSSGEENSERTCSESNDRSNDTINSDAAGSTHSEESQINNTFENVTEGSEENDNAIDSIGKSSSNNTRTESSIYSEGNNSGVLDDFDGSIGDEREEMLSSVQSSAERSVAEYAEYNQDHGDSRDSNYSEYYSELVQERDDMLREMLSEDEDNEGYGSYDGEWE